MTRVPEVPVTSGVLRDTEKGIYVNEKRQKHDTHALTFTGTTVDKKQEFQAVYTSGPTFCFIDQEWHVDTGLGGVVGAANLDASFRVF